MRYRNQAHTVTFSGNWRPYDIKNSVYGGNNAFSVNLVDLESHMWDDPTGGRRITKSCTHLSYVVDQLLGPITVFDSGDTSNSPNARTRYENTPFAFGYVNLRRPSSNIANANGYISVTAQGSDDIGNAVFQAYNRFITGVTALDASVSIAESGETPRLFDAWQRRRAVPSNLVSGFLSYSFGWKPLISDLRAIARELRSFPQTVRKRLKSIGDGEVVRHYSFSLDDTIDDLNGFNINVVNGPLAWQTYRCEYDTVSKSRTVGVTIRAKVKPKLGPEGQAILNKLGALGLVPSLATVWSVTRLSFVIDWFYNIGGAIENLQGCLTHDVSNVSVCVTDSRRRSIRTRHSDTSGPIGQVIGVEEQKAFFRYPATVPLMPALRYPRRAMPYVLLGLLALNKTKKGKLILSFLDNSRISKHVSAKVRAGIEKLSPSKRENLIKAYGSVIPGFKPKS